MVFEVLSFFYRERASVVIPAFNEQKTVRNVAQAALKSRFVGEVIVVDDGSTDKTVEVAGKLGRTRVVLHKRNLGKGLAIKTGIKHAANDVVLFLDADLQNMTPHKIDNLLWPLISGEADFVKAGFSLKRGRVTEIAVKPMMKILFPEHDFSQPISGQFGARKNFLTKIKVIDRWGIDIGIFLDAIKNRLRVVEVDIGEIVHKARSTEEKAEMSRQVMEVMLSKAGLFAERFPNVVFSEHALFSGDSVKDPIASAVIQRLKKRRFNLFLLCYGSAENAREKARQLQIGKYLVAGKNGPLELLRDFKKALKKNHVKPAETAFIGSKTFEATLFGTVGMGIAFSKQKEVCLKADRTIKSLPEILLLEEWTAPA
ncbi:MAG TPA: glycosyltransferase [Candidatus Diapherotrites archaeon]|uniref:Glycosyltransferase n=1 Tax=Candidatus Iainarchaeum sp. TaxID=3101447 RepID=A0A7J4JJP3_9ARCH|nr:glycosyltransferase [Candidatus Diapherotrites archaeon]